MNWVLSIKEQLHNVAAIYPTFDQICFSTHSEEDITMLYLNHICNMGKFETTPKSWRSVCMNLHFYTCMSVITQHLSRIKARLLLLLLSAWFIHTLPLCGNLRCLLNCKLCLCKRPYNKSSQPGMHWPVYTSSAKLLLLFSLPKVPSTLLTSQLHYIKERSVLRSPINHQKFFIIIILCKQWCKILIVP